MTMVVTREADMNLFAQRIAEGRYSTFWVCVCCMLTHANGECDPDHDREPLNAIPATASISMGMLEEEHADTCTEADRNEGCDCVTRTFDTSSCDGCGSVLHGERHALFVVYDMR